MAFDSVIKDRAPVEGLHPAGFKIKWDPTVLANPDEVASDSKAGQ